MVETLAQAKQELALAERLAERIAQRTATIGLIGLGYAGLPLAVAFAEAGFRVAGVDLHAERVAALNAGCSYVGDVATDRLSPLVAAGQFSASTDYATLRDADAITICVPTPLTEAKAPDTRAIAAAMEALLPWLRPGQLIVLESTSYPGTTEELLYPALASRGLVPGEDVFLAFAPERVNPGDRHFGTRNTPKLIGGYTARCGELATRLYETIVDEVVPVSSPRVAEMAKLMENTFRAVNVALANEMALVCEHLGVDVWEVIDAAATKPFGYMPFYPGPGLGGPCIPIVPHYLAWKARELGYDTRFIALADEINDAMPGHVVDLVAAALGDAGKPLSGARVLVLGITYKPDVADTRESPLLPALAHLLARGADAAYHDPHVPQITVQGQPLTSVTLEQATLQAADCVVAGANHSAYDWTWIAANTDLIVDTRNATATIPQPTNRARIVKLGAPRNGAVHER